MSPNVESLYVHDEEMKTKLTSMDSKLTTINTSLSSIDGKLPIKVYKMDIVWAPDFTLGQYGYQIELNQNNKYFRTYCIIPKTSTTWKIIIIFDINGANQTAYGHLSAGSVPCDDSASQNELNIFNAIQFNLASGGSSSRVKNAISSTFTGNQGYFLYITWLKDTVESGGIYLRIRGIYLTNV